MTLRELRRYDISVLVSPATPEWPGDTPFSCGWSWAIARGASVNVSVTSASPHVGTHADAPLHVRDGAPASDALPLDAFHGRAVVLDVSHATAPLDVATLDALLDAILCALPGARGSAAERLLLRTGHSIADGAFPESWLAVTPDCARALTARGMRLLGVDAPSVDARESSALEVHHALFDGGACVLENLDLREVPEGVYELLALPVRLAGLDAAPVRAMLTAM